MKDHPQAAFSPSQQREHGLMFITRCEKCGWPFSTPYASERLCKMCRESVLGGCS